MTNSREIVESILRSLDDCDYLRAHWYYASDITRQLFIDRLVELTEEIGNETDS